MSSPSRNACFSAGNVGDVGEQPQLDLRIVGRHQLVAGRGDEGAADLAAVLGAHRNVLQVRLGRRQPAGRGRGQRVGGVDAVGLRIARRSAARRYRSISASRPAASRGSCCGNSWPCSASSSSTLRRGRPRAGLGLRAAGQAHLAEQDVAELLRAAEIERLAGELLDLGLEPRRRSGRNRPTAATAPGGRSRCRAAPSAPARRPAAVPASRRRWSCRSAARRGLSTCHSRSVTSASSAA